MDLIMVLRRTHIVAEKDAGKGHPIGKHQLPNTTGKADDEGHYQEVGKEEHIFACFHPFHVVHHSQIEVHVDHRQEPGQKELPPQVAMIRYDKDIGRAEINERADIQAENEKGNYTDEVSDKNE
jgi:hypothetical protein